MLDAEQLFRAFNRNDSLEATFVIDEGQGPSPEVEDWFG
jgi:hypothetical protein